MGGKVWLQFKASLLYSIYFMKELMRNNGYIVQNMVLKFPNKLMGEN